MYSKEDLKNLKNRNLSKKDIELQLENFQKGFGYVKLSAYAAVGKGIKKLSGEEEERFIKIYDENTENTDVVKMVPASGSATRMFKMLLSFFKEYDGSQESYLDFIQNKDSESAFAFFKSLRQYPFYAKLADCIWQNGMSLESLIAKKEFTAVLSYLLTEKGLNYGDMPKGLIDFHVYQDFVRTAFDEHIVEGCLYAGNKNTANIHFTVPERHMRLFEKRLSKFKKVAENLYKKKVNISFSVQKPETDTISVYEDGKIVRDENGDIVFRPGGHGALLYNLNDMDEKIIFIKNIDNVVPDRSKAVTVRYKKIIGGMLMELKEKIDTYLEELSRRNTDEKKIAEIRKFVNTETGLKIREYPEFKNPAEEKKFLKAALNRPVRICGMVENSGEPGGGPFWVEDEAGNSRLMIIESTQVDHKDKQQEKIFRESTHFNPVDIVCCIRDYKGKKFDLGKFVDDSQGFISTKSYNGATVKCQELPGLWNGSMAGWITVFVEVPESTFAPVKTVSDLLRFEHRNVISNHKIR